MEKNNNKIKTQHCTSTFRKHQNPPIFSPISTYSFQWSFAASFFKTMSKGTTLICS